MTILKFYPSFNYIAIIDHHRVSPKYKIAANEEYIDTFASSTSEIVSEILLYNENLYSNNIRFQAIAKFTSTLLYAGIKLDTNNFSEKVSSKTFQVLGRLKEWGASVKEVNNLLKNDITIIEQKNKIVANFEVYNKQFAIAYDDSNRKYNSSIIAIAAQELISIHGIICSFAMGSQDDGIYVSCRSISKLINVQKIAESFGGGGSYDSSAFFIKGGDFEQITSKIKEIINKMKYTS